LGRGSQKDDQNDVLNGSFCHRVGFRWISSANLGYVNAFDADDGTELWSYVPVTADNEFLSSRSGITFSATDSLEYVVFSVIVNELSLNPMT
jgi:hypothetical protein